MPEESAYMFLVNFAGLLIFSGFLSVLYNIVAKKVTPRRRGVYALALVMSMILVAIYINFILTTIYGDGPIPPGAIRWSFLVVYVIIGCLFVLLPRVDRVERADWYVPAERMQANLEAVMSSNGDDTSDDG